MAEKIAETYYRTALERIVDAGLLNKEGHYSYAMHTSGLAVECLLRAFRTLKGASFDERHDLWRLWKGTTLAEIRYETSHAQIHQALITISRLWNNGFRFMSQKEMQAFLKNAGQDRGIKGDFLKYRSQELHEAADELIRIGDKRWKQLKKSKISAEARLPR